MPSRRRPPTVPIPPSEITPEAVFRDRRRFLTQCGFVGAMALLGACGRGGEAGAAASRDARDQPLIDLDVEARNDLSGGEAQTDFQTVSTYNNYYEFGTDKADPSRHAHTLRVRPWTVEVGGECEAPGTLDIEDLIGGGRFEERIYRFRCVEAWSMVVPWIGLPLADVLKRYRPTSKARYVAFQTLYDREQMPLSRLSGLSLPYVEGLRIDEAMHPLTLLTLGMYGKTLPNQNGAPLRLVVPWKYGYKSIKSIVRISFVEQEPPTTWNLMAPHEYGFYSNVNPQRRHPRWSQAQERRLGELFKRPTLMWNGYPEVASLYDGMDLLQFH